MIRRGELITSGRISLSFSQEGNETVTAAVLFSNFNDFQGAVFLTEPSQHPRAAPKVLSDSRIILVINDFPLLF